MPNKIFYPSDKPRRLLAPRARKTSPTTDETGLPSIFLCADCERPCPKGFGLCANCLPHAMADITTDKNALRILKEWER